MFFSFLGGLAALREVFFVVISMRRAILLAGLLGVACPTLRAANIQKDDQILFVRDEPLLLYGQPAATAAKGQVYTVLTYQPAERRVYVLARDHTGKTVGLNASDFAVVVLPGRGEPAFQRGLNDLKLAHWPDAVRALAAAVAAEPDAEPYAQVRDAVDGLLTAQRGFQQATAALEKAGELSARKRRNADNTPPSNPLFPADHSGTARAAAYRQAADAIDAAAKGALDTARTALDGSGLAFDAALRSLVDAHAYDAVLALLDARERLLPGRPVDALGGLAHPDLADWNDRVASAYAAAETAGGDLAANRLTAADHEAAGGLVALPADRTLRALQMRVQMRLAAVEDRRPEIDAAEKAGDLAGALRLVNALLADSVDDPALLQRKTALEARLTGARSG